MLKELCAQNPSKFCLKLKVSFMMPVMRKLASFMWLFMHIIEFNPEEKKTDLMSMMTHWNSGWKRSRTFCRNEVFLGSTLLAASWLTGSFDTQSNQINPEERWVLKCQHWQIAGMCWWKPRTLALCWSCSIWYMTMKIKIRDKNRQITDCGGMKRYSTFQHLLFVNTSISWGVWDILRYLFSP